MKLTQKLDVDFLINVSDIHAGSSWAPVPAGMRMQEGWKLRPNEYQRWANKCWAEFWSWVDDVTGKSRRVAVCVVGDATEGVHHSAGELVSNVPRDHSNIAVALLEPHVERRKLYMIEGTECHTRNAESGIGEALNAIPYRKAKGKKEPGIYAWPQFEPEINGCSGIIRHHTPVTSRPYLEASAMSIQLGCDRIESIRSHMKPPRFLVSAHRHKFGAFTDGDAQVVVLPPWQGIGRHVRKVVPSGRVAVGGAILDFRKAGKYDPPQCLFKRFVP